MKFVEENHHKASLPTDITYIKQLDPFIGQLTLESVHMGSLQPYIQYKRKEKFKARTINNALQITRRILNLASTEWIDEHGLTWLATAAKIKLLPENDKRPAYPLNWDEQEQFFSELPEHLLKMALFTVNTGCREAEVSNLRWEWEVLVPELSTSVFIIPADKVKNRKARLVVPRQSGLKLVEKSMRSR